MELEDKKLIAEKLMGWEVHHDNDNDFDWYSDCGQCIEVESAWNPHRDRNVWPEIWKKIWEKGLQDKYVEKVDDWFYENQPIEWQGDGQWLIHTAPPEICTKALLKVLKGE